MKLILIAAAAGLSLAPVTLAAQTSMSTASTTTRTETVEKPVVHHVVRHTAHRKHRAKAAPAHHVVVKHTAATNSDGSTTSTTDVSTPK